MQEETNLNTSDLEPPVQRLHRTVQTVMHARFHGSHRLNRHQSLSMWAIAFSSIFLIVLPLLATLGLEVNISEGWLTISQVTVAILILVVSIQVNGSRFGTRAQEMYRCGRELSALKREIYHLLLNNSDEAKVRAAQRAYDDILSRYENHSYLDFRRAQISGASSYYKTGTGHRVVTDLRTAIEYSPYLLLVLGIAILAVFIIEAG